MNKNSRVLGIKIAVSLVVLWFFPLSAGAQVDCSQLSHWAPLENNLGINQKHVFCGEWHRNRPKGFHARPNGVNPGTVADFIVQDEANAAGIYTGRWSYRGHADKRKFSSMFPDRCTVAQILNSIAYAAENPVQCPRGAPRWTQCGPNQPAGNKGSDDANYCSVDERRFTILFAPPRNGQINTAFPFFE